MEMEEGAELGIQVMEVMEVMEVVEEMEALFLLVQSLSPVL